METVLVQIPLQIFAKKFIMSINLLDKVTEFYLKEGKHPMWDRRIIKSNAKTALKGRYWICFAVALIACILAGTSGLGRMNIWNMGGAERAFSNIEDQLDPYSGYSEHYDYYDNWDDYGYYDDFHDFNGRYDYYGDDPFSSYSFWDELGYGGMAVLSVIGVVLLIVFGLALAFQFFVGNPIAMGKCRFFIHNRFGDTKFEHLFGAFKSGYLSTVGALCTTTLLVDMWLYIMMAIMIFSLFAILGGAYAMSLLIFASLFLVIPYVIKAYQYYFVKYLLADNPTLTGSRARQISSLLTSGEKGAIFTLDLSFIGWYFLGSLCFGLGGLFVNPYYEASVAELYIFLRDRAVQNGFIDPAELNLTGGVPPVTPFSPFNPQSAPVYTPPQTTYVPYTPANPYTPPTAPYTPPVSPYVPPVNQNMPPYGVPVPPPAAPVPEKPAVNLEKSKEPGIQLEKPEPPAEQPRIQLEKPEAEGSSDDSQEPPPPVIPTSL